MPQQVEKWREKKQSMWKTFCTRLSVFCCLWRTGGCVRQEKKSSEQHELEIKIVTEEEIPEELMSLIEKNKKNPVPADFCGSGEIVSCRGIWGAEDNRIQCGSGPALRNTGSSPYPYRSSRTGKRRRKKGDCNLSLCSSGTRRDRKKYPV